MRISFNREEHSRKSKIAILFSHISVIAIFVISFLLQFFSPSNMQILKDNVLIDNPKRYQYLIRRLKKIAKNFKQPYASQATERCSTYFSHKSRIAIHLISFLIQIFSLSHIHQSLQYSQHNNPRQINIQNSIKNFSVEVLCSVLSKWNIISVHLHFFKTVYLL